MLRRVISSLCGSALAIAFCIAVPGYAQSSSNSKSSKSSDQAQSQPAKTNDQTSQSNPQQKMKVFANQPALATNELKYIAVMNKARVAVSAESRRTRMADGSCCSGATRATLPLITPSSATNLMKTTVLGEGFIRMLYAVVFRGAPANGSDHCIGGTGRHIAKNDAGSTTAGGCNFLVARRCNCSSAGRSTEPGSCL